MRQCPQCGRTTDKHECSVDGTPTLRVAEQTAGRLEPGVVLDGRYRLDTLLGRGGAARVYDATNLTGEGPEKLAIKVVSGAAEASDGTAATRFVREAAITASLVEPTTVAMLDYGRTERGELYAVMERLNGESLEARLKRFSARGRPLPTGEVIKVGMCVLRSLAEAHGHGLVHRDVKPANIIFHRVRDGDAAKRSDFGRGRVSGSQLPAKGSAIGTAAYMSPEQARGLDVDGRSDLYSLGCVLYQCLAGRTPFSGRRTVIAMLQAHLMEPPRPLADVVRGIEPELAAVVHMALQKNADDRFQTAVAMARALRSVPQKSGFQRADDTVTGPALKRRERGPLSRTPASLKIALEPLRTPTQLSDPGRARDARQQRDTHGEDVHDEPTQQLDEATAAISRQAIRDAARRLERLKKRGDG